MLTIYTKNNCSACVNAKQLLTVRGIEFKAINCDEDFDAYDFIVSQNHRSFPQIYNEDGTLYVSGGFAGLKEKFNA